MGSDLAAHHQALVTALNNGQVTVTKNGSESPSHTGQSIYHRQTNRQTERHGIFIRMETILMVDSLLLREVGIILKQRLFCCNVF